MNDRRLARLQEQIKASVATIVLRDLADPKLGLVTITRVELDREFTQCKVFWSVLGDDKVRARSAAALQRARGYVQRLENFCQDHLGKPMRDLGVRVQQVVLDGNGAAQDKLQALKEACEIHGA